jgi:hypothetical protein
MTTQAETVTTWANGYGIWHARVNFPANGYTDEYLANHGRRIRAKARRAIRREIEARGDVGPGWRCQVVTAQDSRTSSEGPPLEGTDVRTLVHATQWITYREK